MPTRGPLGRSLIGIGLLLGGLVLIVGGLALRGAGLVALAVAGGVAAALAAGVVRESPDRVGRRSVVEVAWQAAACTVGGVLLIAGITALAGGVVAALLTGTAVVVVGAVVGARRLTGRTSGAPTPTGSAPPDHRPAGVAAPGSRSTTPAGPLPPVSGLPTWALGREWLRTTNALASRLQPAARASIVRRRQETLDELERRDPLGFARWLATGPRPGSDPAQYVRGDAGRLGDEAAGTDAA